MVNNVSVNYVGHETAFFASLFEDNGLKHYDIAVYYILFQLWNCKWFQSPMRIYRSEIMRLARVSKGCYYQSLQRLTIAKRITYIPGNHENLAEVIIILFEKSITGAVSKTSHPSLELGTTPVLETGHSSKQKIIKNVNSTVPNNNKNFDSEKRMQKTIGPPLPVSGHPKDSAFSNNIETLYSCAPTLEEVELYFLEMNISPEEAKAFYNHNQKKGWKFKHGTPIKVWKAIANKWIAKIRSGQTPAFHQNNVDTEIKFLFDLHCENKRIIHLVTPVHFDYLKLKLTNETLDIALKERMEELLYSKKHSDKDIYLAYEKEDKNDTLIINDQKNLQCLAKKIAVIGYFDSLRIQGETKVSFTNK